MGRDHVHDIPADTGTPTGQVSIPVAVNRRIVGDEYEEQDSRRKSKQVFSHAV